MERFKYLDKSVMNDLPKTSGVYCFTEKKAEDGLPLSLLLYIGKAINIQSRVKNHFQQPSYRDKIFIDKVAKIGFFETNSEIEALILEAALIKKYQPKFNVMWRDDKNYFWVAFEPNSQGAPYVYITHQPKPISNLKFQISNSDYIGPFVEGTALKKTLRFLRRAFPYYSQKNHPKAKCTYCHLDLCPGPNPDLKLYKKNLNNLKLVLQGKKNSAQKSLKAEMSQLAKEKKFEEAGKIRDRMRALESIMAHTHVIENGYAKPNPGILLGKIIGAEKNIERIECFDVSNIQGKQATASMAVFTNGSPDKNEYRKFKIRMKNEPNDIAMLKEAIGRRLSHQEWPLPDVILIDGGRGQLNAALKILNFKFKIKVISIAKKNKELFIEGREKPILLKTLPQDIYNLIIYLDDEAHRFAISYHKKLRQKNLLK